MMKTVLLFVVMAVAWWWGGPPTPLTVVAYDIWDIRAGQRNWQPLSQ